MIVEVGAPVILRLEQPDLWHIPVPARELLSHVEVSIDDALARFTTSWGTLCGETGDVFVYDGTIRRRRLCRGCALRNRKQPLVMPPSELAAAALRDDLIAQLDEILERSA